MSTWSTGPARVPACAALTLAALTFSPAWSAADPQSSGAATSQEPVSDIQRRIQELISAHAAADDAFWTGYEERAAAVRAEADEAKKKELQAALDTYLREDRPGPKFLPRFEELAVAAAGSPAAFDAWLKVLELDEKSEKEDVDRPARRAFAALLDGFVDSERMGDVVAMLQRGVLPHERLIDGFRAVRAKSPHRSVQGAALLALAGELSGRRAVGSDKAKARDAYLEIAKDFADLEQRGRSYGTIAEGFLFDLDHLQVGMVAPDFEAIDENGARFKLSDYRGKVVLLDFWGFW
jgi:hypothetical protein